MAPTNKITDSYIASARLEFLYSKSPITRWKDLPHYGKATSDSAGGYSGYGKVAYSFRQPQKGGHKTDAAKLILAIGNNPGSSPAELRRIVGIRDGFCVSLFDSLRLWMLAKSIKGKYYLTNTGVQYAAKMLYSGYKAIMFYDFVTEQLVSCNVAGADKLSKMFRIEIPAGLTNEEVKDVLDKAYIRYITA